jgi:hypothetical protein
VVDIGKHHHHHHTAVVDDHGTLVSATRPACSARPVARPGRSAGPGHATGSENSAPSGGNSGGDSGNGGGSGSSGSGGKPSGNVTQAVPVVQQKEKCGWFAPVCNGWQRSMEWVHENQDTFGHIAIDLIEIDAGASLITGGATLAAGGGVSRSAAAAWPR